MKDSKEPRTTKAASVDRLVIECINCGLPQCKNPHPNAGKPEHLNRVGACMGCLPCAERRANGRLQMLFDLRRWAENEYQETDSYFREQAMRDVVDKINRLEDERRREFAASR